MAVRTPAPTRLLPKLDALARLAVVPEVRALSIGEMLGYLLKGAGVAGLEATGERVDNGVAAGVEAAGVRGAARHVPVGATAEVVGVHACAEEAGDRVALAIEELVVLDRKSVV